MRFFPLILFLFLLTGISFSQNSIKIIVTDHDSGEPLTGANVFLLGTDAGASTDETGLAKIQVLNPGSYQLRISFIGYNEETIEVTVPGNEDVINVELEHEAEEMEEITVSSTRSSRLIGNVPTRVEVIAGEEIDEKISMDPSNISMMLNESTGIQVQQTSALSVSSTFRIQGLEGRYTQLLKDGFPLYSGFSGSLSILQIPPLDIQQIEIIKGSSSTLYGGGAIAGLINLISKTPDPRGELSFLLNGTSASGLDLSGYYSKQYGKFGITFLASRNTQKVYDNNSDSFSDLPKTERYTLTPRFFLELNEKNKIELGGSFVTEDREGGFIPLAQNVYGELNKSKRFSTQFKYERTAGEGKRLTFKNSIGYFHRNLKIPSFEFTGRQVSSFTEASYTFSEKNFDWMTGLNLITEDFRDLKDGVLSYSDITAGAFAQAVFDISEMHSIESGLRVDYAKNYDFYFLPRISFMSKWSPAVTTRIGGGLGYKLPDLFTEDAEEIYFKNILPLDRSGLNAEKSYGLNFDINYNAVLFKRIALSVNNLFFYTRISDPLILSFIEPLNSYEFISLDGFYDTKGIETNIKFSLGHIKLFTGYTYINVTSPGSENEQTLLTPKHRLGLVLIYEKHDSYRIGLEAYYTGSQRLSSNGTGRSYWINGLMLEKHFNNISLFLNFENFLDVRQSKYGPMFTGVSSDPQFVEIYAPTDGRIINGGVKIRF